MSLYDNRISEEGLSLIKKFEGCRLEAYKCSGGVWTIGYGHTKDVQEGDKWAKEKAEFMLWRELEDEYEIDSPAALSDEETAELIDKPAIDVIALMECFGDDKLAQQSFLRFYQQHSKPILTELKANIENKDWKSVVDLTHTLKSSTRGAGALLLADYCEKLEQLAKDENMEPIVDLSHKLYSEFERVSEHIDLNF